MKLKNPFKKEKIEFGDYRDSTHADTYEQIAKRLNSTPQHVYEIAHGKGAHSFDDRVIWSELAKEHIVHY